MIRYTIYPIDLAGRQNAQRISAANAGGVGIDFQAAPSTTSGPPGLADSAADPGPTVEGSTGQLMDAVMAKFEAVAGREQSVEGPLISLARETGGEPMLNSFRASALPRCSGPWRTPAATTGSATLPPGRATTKPTR